MELSLREYKLCVGSTAHRQLFSTSPRFLLNTRHADSCMQRNLFRHWPSVLVVAVTTGIVNLRTWIHNTNA